MLVSDPPLDTPTGPSHPVWMRVFHNNAPEAFLEGYRDGHSLTEVFTYTTTRPTPDTRDHELADEAYQVFNAGDDPAFGAPDRRALDYRRCGNRSLSIGDVVAIDGRFLACDHVGWHALPSPPPMQQTTTHGTTALY